MLDNFNKLSVNICGVHFNTPIIAASGTFGYGLEFENYTDLSKIGGISVKGLSLNPCPGNPMPRIVETRSGMLNAIGLENVGVHRFIEEKLPRLAQYDTRIIANFWGKSIEEYVEVAKILNNVDRIDMLEMNVSCPNVKEGGISFSSSPEALKGVLEPVRKVLTKKPLIVKLSPNVSDIRPFAIAVEESGADIISAINTFIGTAIDIECMKPILSNITGGLSGPAIKPVALRFVKEIASVTKLPIIGIGGITEWQDAIEFILAGATLVQVGTANFVNSNACVEIAEGMNSYLVRKTIEHFSNIIGKAFAK